MKYKLYNKYYRQYLVFSTFIENECKNYEGIFDATMIMDPNIERIAPNLAMARHAKRRWDFLVSRGDYFNSNVDILKVHAISS